jgi:hypothetical protein
MIFRVANVLGIALMFFAIPVAAFAGPGPIAVPEPATITLVAAGLGATAAVYAIRKWNRRK